MEENALQHCQSLDELLSIYYDYLSKPKQEKKHKEKNEEWDSWSEKEEDKQAKLKKTKKQLVCTVFLINIL